MAETARIADQLIKAFEGGTWTGRSVREIVAEFSPATAASHPIAGGNSAWELLAHITTWLRNTQIRLGGTPHEPTPEEDFPRFSEASAEGWNAAWVAAEEGYRELSAAIRAFPDNRLDETAPGKDYSVYHMLHGVIQHSLYHAGQMALLHRFTATR